MNCCCKRSFMKTFNVALWPYIYSRKVDSGINISVCSCLKYVMKFSYVKGSKRSFSVDCSLVL
jgi:hypothetical protein